VGVLLGNGWYNHQSTAVWDFDKAGWRARPRFCLNIRLTYADGSSSVIATYSSSKTSLSPVVFCSIYTAEHYDAQLEQEDWNSTRFDDSAWKFALKAKASSINIVTHAIPPIRNVKEIKPVSINKISNKGTFFTEAEIFPA